MLVHSDKWCVYHHTHNGQVFYIGVGQIDRAFNLMGRSGRWLVFVDSIDGQYVVVIDKWFETREEALEFEQSQILKILPVTNRESWSKENEHRTKERWFELLRSGVKEYIDQLSRVKI